MVDRILRRLSVGRRIIAGFLALVILLALTIPATIADHTFLISRLQQVTDVEANADRMLLQASVRIQSSRVNLLRYAQDYLPSTQVAQEDIYDATQFLIEAQNLITAQEQNQAIAAVLAELTQYREAVIGVESARRAGESQTTTRLLFEATKTGNDLEQRIEGIVQKSKDRVAATNEDTNTEAQVRLTVLILGYASILVLSLILVTTITRSITHPIDALRSGAEAFGQGQLETLIPETGRDELTLLARTFNQMAKQVTSSYLELEQRVQDRTSDLQQRTAYMEAAAEVSSAAASILDADQLIRQVVDLIRERFNLYYVGLFLTDETQQWAKLQAGTGEAGQKMLARGHKIKVGSGMIGWSVANAQARIALEAGEDTVRLATTELPETRSEAAIPLRSRGQVLGAFTVQSSQPGAFDQASIAALQIMADQVAVALDNARLFAASRAALDAERRAYGELTKEAWGSLLRTQSELGYLCNIEGTRPTEGQWQPEMLQASQAGQTIKANDRTLAVPIKIRDQVLGVVRLDKPGEAEEWTAPEIVLIETLIEQLGTALESARLYQDTQRRAARERLTGEITTRMRETLDIETMLITATQEIRQSLDLPEVVIRLLPPTHARKDNGGNGER